MSTPLVQAYLVGRGSSKAPAPTEAVLSKSISVAQKIWPDFGIEPADFAQFLGERVAPADLERAPLADLYLACACLTHEPRAIVELDTKLRRECAAIAQRHRGNVNANDMVLELHGRLLLGERPRLAEYSGKGSLGGWLAATAARAGLNAKREGDRRRKREESAEPSAAGLADPELELLRARSRDVFNVVFREVLDSLDPKERALLRLHVVEGMGIDKISRLRDIGRSTAARWLAQIRTKLLNETRRLLGERLSIGVNTLDELLPVLTSDLDISIRKVLSKEI